MAAVKVLQVVGFKNSGKTTFVSQLIKEAGRHGKTAAVIKHHGHGGALDMPSSETDSMRLFEAGAVSSIAYGDGVIQLHAKKPGTGLEELIRLSLHAGPDLVLVEGFKEAPFEKVILVRSPSDWDLLKGLTNIALVVVHEGVQLPDAAAVERSENSIIGDWFVRWMEGDTDESI